MAADQLEALEGERGPGTIPNEAFETSTVRGLDADTGVQAKTPVGGENLIRAGRGITGGSRASCQRVEGEGRPLSGLFADMSTRCSGLGHARMLVPARARGGRISLGKAGYQAASRRQYR